MLQDGPDSDLNMTNPIEQITTHCSPYLRPCFRGAHKTQGMHRKLHLQLLPVGVFIFLPSLEAGVITTFRDQCAGVAISCTLLGALLGLVAAMHRAFFARDGDPGGGNLHA